MKFKELIYMFGLKSKVKSFGFKLLMLGVIGEYVWRILSQARNRPKYIIHKIMKPRVMTI